MKIQKKYLELLFRAVSGYKTDKLADARIRDSFLKTLSDNVDTFIKDRNDVYVKFCNKDEEENPIITDNKYTFKKEVIVDLNKELNILIEEEIDIESSSNNEKIKEFIENSKYETEAGESLAIDEILKLL